MVLELDFLEPLRADSQLFLLATVSAPFVWVVMTELAELARAAGAAAGDDLDLVPEADGAEGKPSGVQGVGVVGPRERTGAWCDGAIVLFSGGCRMCLNR